MNTKVPVGDSFDFPDADTNFNNNNKSYNLYRSFL